MSDKTSNIKLIFEIGQLIFYIIYAIYICSVLGTIPLGQLTILDFVIPAVIIYTWMIIIALLIVIIFLILLGYSS